MALRISPDVTYSATLSTAQKQNAAPSAPGVVDTLRNPRAPRYTDASAPLAAATHVSGLATAASSAAPSTANPLDNTPVSSHPLEARLRAWNTMLYERRLESVARVYGLGEALRQGMELVHVQKSSWRPAELKAVGDGLPSVHEEILTGRDTQIDWEDVYTDAATLDVPGFHAEMERKLNM